MTTYDERRSGALERREERSRKERKSFLLPAAKRNKILQKETQRSLDSGEEDIPFRTAKSLPGGGRLLLHPSKMPFLSPDWRSPGEKWVRYEGGWKMKKTVWATQCFR